MVVTSAEYSERRRCGRARDETVEALGTTKGVLPVHQGFGYKLYDELRWEEAGCWLGMAWPRQAAGARGRMAGWQRWRVAVSVRVVVIQEQNKFAKWIRRSVDTSVCHPC